MSRGVIVSIIVVLCVLAAWVAGMGSVAEVRGRIEEPRRPASERTAAPSNAPAQKPSTRSASPAFTDYEVSAGTVVAVKLGTTVRSATSSVGDQVDATLTEAIMQDGVELLPPGSVMHGTVVDALGASPREPRGRIAVPFSVIEHVRTRSRAAIKTRTVAVDARRSAGKRSANVELAASQTLNVVLTKPLLVRIPE